MLAAGFIVLLTISSAEAEDDKKILILNSYHRSYSWSDEEEAGVIKRLRGVYPAIDIPVEYLDTKRLSDPDGQRITKDFLKRKYRDKWIDLIVALDNPSMDLLTQYRGELFPGVPVVFTGISDYRQYMESGRGKVTGVVERHDVKNGRELYELLRRDRPGMKALFMSGYPGDVIGHHGILGGDVNFLQKPFTAAALSRQVRRALGTHGNHDDDRAGT